MNVVDKRSQITTQTARKMRVVTSGREFAEDGVPDHVALIQRTVNGPQPVIATDLLRARHNVYLLSIEALQLSLRRDCTRGFVGNSRVQPGLGLDKHLRLTRMQFSGWCCQFEISAHESYLPRPRQTTTDTGNNSITSASLTLASHLMNGA